jgi:phosphoglycerate kinase
MLERVDKIIIGGAMANTFLQYRGLSVGKSLVENECLPDAGRIMASAVEKDIGLLLPVDLVVAEAMVENAEARTVTVQKVPENMMALDIGPETVKAYHHALQGAGTIVWNGPMGVFEMPPFSGGTMSLAKSIAASTGLTIIGGGDTGAAVRMAGVETDMSYISTGGGAFLTLLEGKVLPAVEVLPE